MQKRASNNSKIQYNVHIAHKKEKWIRSHSLFHDIAYKKKMTESKKGALTNKRQSE